MYRQGRGRQLSSRTDTNSPPHNPEYMLPYVVHSLAYHPTFPNVDECRDAKAYEGMYRYIRLAIIIVKLSLTRSRKSRAVVILFWRVIVTLLELSTKGRSLGHAKDRIIMVMLCASLFSHAFRFSRIYVHLLHQLEKNIHGNVCYLIQSTQVGPVEVNYHFNWAFMSEIVCYMFNYLVEEIRFLSLLCALSFYLILTLLIIVQWPKKSTRTNWLRCDSLDDRGLNLFNHVISNDLHDLIAIVVSVLIRSSNR